MSDLTQERVRELFDYDGENGILIRKKDWYGRIVNQPCGIKPNRNGYGQVKIDGKTYLPHRIIWLWHKGYLPEFIDHWDRDRMNNRIENLRPATRAENGHNHGLHRDNTSGYPGVYFYKPRKKYRAHIRVDGRRIDLGLFNTAEEAFRVHQLAKIKYHPTSPISQQYKQELGITI